MDQNNSYTNWPADNNTDIIENEPLKDFGVDSSGQNQNSQSPKSPRGVWKFFIIMLVIIILLLSAIFAVGFFYFKENKNNPVQKNNFGVISSSSVSVQSPQRILAENKDRPSLGNLNAPLVIVEFGDFQCTKSQQEYTQIRQAVLKNKNNVLFIFRNFPVIDNNSTILAKAGFCAHDQGRFWQFHDKLYENQADLTSVETIRNIATASGINMEKFSSCLKSDSYSKILEKDIADAGALGVIGTPTFFVNGNKLEGIISSPDWESIINKYQEILNK
ncbi:MAG: thioredoxin domain-containing protein [Candidatus Buchananbacteria bacterium]